MCPKAVTYARRENCEEGLQRLCLLLLRSPELDDYYHNLERYDHKCGDNEVFRKICEILTIWHQDNLTRCYTNREIWHQDICHGKTQ